MLIQYIAAIDTHRNGPNDISCPRMPFDKNVYIAAGKKANMNPYTIPLNPNTSPQTKQSLTSPPPTPSFLNIKIDMQFINSKKPPPNMHPNILLLMLSIYGYSMVISIIPTSNITTWNLSYMYPA